jgi:putative transposase
VIEKTHEANYCAYGYRKMWLALRTAGETVGRDHVKRLMRRHGIRGAKPARPDQTTLYNLLAEARWFVPPRAPA